MARSNSFKNIFKLIDAQNGSLQPHESFLADLKRSIELDVEKNQSLPSKTYKPSGMNCIRASYYQIKGVQPDDGKANYTLIGIGNSGTDTHLRIQSAVNKMKNNGMDCEYINVADYVRNRNLDYLEIRKEPDFEHGEYETKLYHKDLNISFLCDGIIKYKGKYYILEIKTESSYKFMTRKDVDPKHHNQAITYSMALQIEDVIFVYINRDLLDMKSFCFHVTSTMIHGIMNYITECNGYLERNITPPKPQNITNKICQYCIYKTQCRKEG